ncbi:MAG: carboxypeptidase regulatory-like domain-containing protein, partial [Anaerolineae bacterium]|nr:carboxypeptidase regulatory-like domain-containing protein [Anaerolineae bacterium]
PQPLPIPDHPAVLVDVQPNGGQLAVNFRLFKIEGLYGLEANCSADPNVLGGLTRADGDGFNASNSFFIDQGFNATSGAWLVAASRLLPAEPIAGDLTAFSLGYTLKNSGDPKLNCTLRAVDRNGRDLIVEVINGTVAPLQPAAVVQPDLMQPPVEMPVILVPGEAQFSSVAGVVTYANPTDNTGINVELMGGDYEVLAQIVTSVNGAYQFTDVPAGAYYLRASAPGHLQVLKTILVDGNSPVVDLSTDTLIAGDTDNNGVVDITDASFIGANFNLQAPPAPLEIDLNRDNLVNIGDLVLVGTNFGATSPGQ